MAFYLGIVDRAADGSWGIWFPDLPGCTSAGEDLDELYRNSIEALRLWAQDAIADREALPGPRSHDVLMEDTQVRETMRQAGSAGSILQVPLLLEAGRSVRAIFRSTPSCWPQSTRRPGSAA